MYILKIHWFFLKLRGSHGPPNSIGRGPHVYRVKHEFLLVFRFDTGLVLSILQHSTQTKLHFKSFSSISRWFLANNLEFMISTDWYHMIPLIHNSSVWFVLNHEAPKVQSRGRGFESHRKQKLICQILLIFKNWNKNFNFK